MARKETIYSYEQLPLMLSAEQVASVLGVSRATAYNLIHEDGFPCVQIGNRFVVPRDQFAAWIDDNCRRPHS